MTPFLVDTGFIVALIDRSDAAHSRCAAAMETIQTQLVTCEAVISEATYLLRATHRGSDLVMENVEAGVLEVPFRLASCARSIRTLMKKYARIPMDFADACLVQLADEVDTGRILTLDDDFRVYRWRRNRAFELLLDERD